MTPFVRQYGILSNKWGVVHCGIVQVLLFPGQLPGFQHPGKKNALVIIEMAFRRQVGSSKLAHHCIAGGAGKTFYLRFYFGQSGMELDAVTLDLLS